MDIVEKNYPGFRQFFNDNFPFDLNDNNVGKFDPLIINSLPKLENIKISVDVYDVLMKDFLKYYDSNQVIDKSKLYDFANQLFEFYKKNGIDSQFKKIKTRLHNSSNILIFLNLITILIININDNGFSLGTSFLIFSLIIWLIPSFIAYYALKMRKNKRNENKQVTFTIINWILIIGHMYLLIKVLT